MKKRFLASVAMVLALCGMAKAEDVQTLTINGQKVEKVVSQLTFEGDNVVLHFGDSKEAYSMGDVQISFSGFDGINGVSTFKLAGFVDGQLVIGGLATGTPVAVYDISGKKLSQTKADGEVTRVSLDDLNGGAYILKAGNQIVKFIKR